MIGGAIPLSPLFLPFTSYFYFEAAYSAKGQGILVVKGQVRVKLVAVVVINHPNYAISFFNVFKPKEDFEKMVCLLNNCWTLIEKIFWSQNFKISFLLSHSFPVWRKQIDDHFGQISFQKKMTNHIGQWPLGFVYTIVFELHFPKLKNPTLDSFTRDIVRWGIRSRLLSLTADLNLKRTV